MARPSISPSPSTWCCERVSRAASTSPAIESWNPATGERLGTVSEASVADVRAAVSAARQAQLSWGALPVSERAARVSRLRGLIVARADALSAQISAENGKTRFEALMMEVFPLAELVRYFCKHAEEILAPRRIPLALMKHRRSYVHYAPRGVVGIIAPWNFPLAIPFGESVMALLAGNAVVLKPSDLTPLIAEAALSLFREGGIPDDLVRIVHGRGATGAALIDASVDQVCFTGSVTTGRKVAAACGERLIPCTLELGGKAPAIVCDDADLERTAQALVWGAFANSGQVCASVERVYAHTAIHDELVTRVVEHAARLRQGDPASFETDVGAICFPRQLDVARALIDDAVAQGARVVLGGAALPLSAGPDGFPRSFFQPTVVTHVRPSMRILREESFAPLLPIMRVTDVDEAVRLANDSDYGLLGYVFTGDRAKGRAIAERIRAGTVMVNDVLMTYGLPETPWAGVKHSGIGRVHSAEGLRELCETRHVHHDAFFTPPRELWWYPYGKSTYKNALKALRLFLGGRGGA